MAFTPLFLFTVLVALLVGGASAATYIVGDSLGWVVPPNGPADYTSWASRHTFRVGDNLLFNFQTGFHDVAHVTIGGFDGCSSTNPIALNTVGPANFTLNSTGPTYYICTFGQHCSLGQKLAINVSAASTGPAPAPTPTPTPTPTPSPSPTPSPLGGAPSSSSPGTTPSPTPSGTAAAPPPLPSELAPGSAPLPAGGLSPPPPPSSGTVASFSVPLVTLASVALGLLI